MSSALFHFVFHMKKSEYLGLSKCVVIAVLNRAENQQKWKWHSDKSFTLVKVFGELNWKTKGNV